MLKIECFILLSLLFVYVNTTNLPNTPDIGYDDDAKRIAKVCVEFKDEGPQHNSYLFCKNKQLPEQEQPLLAENYAPNIANYAADNDDDDDDGLHAAFESTPTPTPDVDLRQYFRQPPQRFYVGGNHHRSAEPAQAFFEEHKPQPAHASKSAGAVTQPQALSPAVAQYTARQQYRAQTQPLPERIQQQQQQQQVYAAFGGRNAATARPTAKTTAYANMLGAQPTQRTTNGGRQQFYQAGQDNANEEPILGKAAPSPSLSAWSHDYNDYAQERQSLMSMNLNKMPDYAYDAVHTNANIADERLKPPIRQQLRRRPLRTKQQYYGKPNADELQPCMDCQPRLADATTWQQQQTNPYFAMQPIVLAMPMPCFNKFNEFEPGLGNAFETQLQRGNETNARRPTLLEAYETSEPGLIGAMRAAVAKKKPNAPPLDAMVSDNQTSSTLNAQLINNQGISSKNETARQENKAIAVVNADSTKAQLESKRQKDNNDYVDSDTDTDTDTETHEHNANYNVKTPRFREIPYYSQFDPPKRIEDAAAAADVQTKVAAAAKNAFNQTATVEQAEAVVAPKSQIQKRHDLRYTVPQSKRIYLQHL